MVWSEESSRGCVLSRGGPASEAVPQTGQTLSASPPGVGLSATTSQRCPLGQVNTFGIGRPCAAHKQPNDTGAARWCQGGCRSTLSLPALGREEVGQDRRAAVGEDAADDLGAVVQPGVIGDLIERVAG